MLVQGCVLMDLAVLHISLGSSTDTDFPKAEKERVLLNAGLLFPKSCTTTDKNRSLHLREFLKNYYYHFGWGGGGGGRLFNHIEVYGRSRINCPCYHTTNVFESCPSVQ